MAMPMPMPPMPPVPSDDMPPMGPMPAMDMPAMHMAFFWGHRAQVLFPNWPGDRGGAGMYVLCLFVVAALAALLEALSAASHGGLARRSRNSSAPEVLLITGVHAAKMGLSYLAMLAVMSFNAGVFLAVVAGHAAGFMLVRSRVLSRITTPEHVPTNGILAPPESKP